MLGLYCDETYGAMIKHDDRDDVGDNDRNKDRNDGDNAASGLRSGGPIFNPIIMHWSRLSIAEEYWATTMTTLQLWRPMYLRVGVYLIYRYPMNDIVNMCHKLLYAKIGILDLCC